VVKNAVQTKERLIILTLSFIRQDSQLQHPGAVLQGFGKVVDLDVEFKQRTLAVLDKA
jgi:hypothetical protein